ncbi:transposase [Micromonospora sp. IBSANI012]|uniref:transposase n=1 Tax=Micromonospora sp. IBSANI012 TaxID=3457761 RepID=UPI0040596E87
MAWRPTASTLFDDSDAAAQVKILPASRTVICSASLNAVQLGTQRLVADGETVVDVPAKLSARARVFATGQGRKTDPVDARSVAVVALRTEGLRQVVTDDTTVALRLLVDRRDQLGRARTDVVSRLHHLLLELVPDGAKKDLSAQQARALLGTVRPRDVVGKTRRRLASELIGELVVIDKKIKTAKQELTDLVNSTGSRLMDLTGIGPSGAARLIGDIADIARFTSRAHFASWNGTAPIDASSGDQNRHRLSRAGNRRINRALHIMAIVQLRRDTEGRRYYRRRLAAGKTPMEAPTGTEAAAVRHRLPADGGRREAGQDGSGRTRGGDSAIQRGRPEPRDRHFGKVTSRTRHSPA